MVPQSLVPFVPMYRASIVVFRATSRWISRFQFWVYGDTRLYVLMVCERSFVGMAKGTTFGVPAGNGTGSVTFERDVYVAGVYVTPVPPEPTRLIPGTVPTVLS